jgi:hypothetical protein
MATVALTTIALPPHEQDSGQGIPSDLGIPGQSGFDQNKDTSEAGQQHLTGPVDGAGDSDSNKKVTRCSNGWLYCSELFAKSPTGSIMSTCSGDPILGLCGFDHPYDPTGLFWTQTMCTNKFGYRFPFWDTWIDGCKPLS